MLTSLSILLLHSLPQAIGVSKDMTGLQWVQPFGVALKAAKAQNRLLMIKPVAFGTSMDGGW